MSDLEPTCRALETERDRLRAMADIIDEVLVSFKKMLTLTGVASPCGPRHPTESTEAVKKAHHRQPDRPLASATCARAGCGAAFTMNKRGKPKRYCSHRCTKAAAKERQHIEDADTDLAVERAKHLVGSVRRE